MNKYQEIILDDAIMRSDEENGPKNVSEYLRWYLSINSAKDQLKAEIDRLNNRIHKKKG